MPYIVKIRIYWKVICKTEFRYASVLLNSQEAVLVRKTNFACIINLRQHIQALQNWIQVLPEPVGGQGVIVNLWLVSCIQNPSTHNLIILSKVDMQKIFLFFFMYH